MATVDEDILVSSHLVKVDTAVPHAGGTTVDEDILVSSRPHLLSHPSVVGWKSELYKVLVGERENDILRLGSASDYVAPYLATKANQGAAKHRFLEALESVFQQWSPQPDCPEYYFRNALNLAEVYHPGYAVPGILAYFDQSEWFGPDEDYEEWIMTVQDTHLQALRVLKKAFSGNYLRPTQFEHYFNVYCDLLWKHVRAESTSRRYKYAAYATGELVRLAKLDPDSNAVCSILQQRDISNGWKKHLESICNRRHRDRAGVFIPMYRYDGNDALFPRPIIEEKPNVIYDRFNKIEPFDLAVELSKPVKFNIPPIREEE